MSDSVGLLYLDRLSDADLAVLSEGAGERGSRAERVLRLRADPGSIPDLLERPAAFRALFAERSQPDFLFASPHLAFSVLVATVWRELADVAFVREWVAPRRTVPVFDVLALREFAEDRMRRLFLADLLSSYTHVASGPVWVRSGRRWTRRRFSELDPLHLIRLIEATPEHEHPPLYRRLGDLSLFLAGVFPAHAASRLFGGRLDRLQRALGTDRALETADPIELLERVGRRSYRMVSREARVAPRGMANVLEDVAEGFSFARRILNFLTERHLFPVREGWFGQSLS
jgi:hypothetical protein